MPTMAEEALRYLGAANAGEALRQKMSSLAAETARDFPSRYIYRETAVQADAFGMRLVDAGVTLPGRMAQTMLASCSRAAVLVCTLGARFDAELRMWQARDMARAAMLDACGSAGVENGCDAAERAIRAAHPGLYLTDRFSPGYGDLPLSVQGALLRFTDAGRRLGVTLSESCLMNPVKTVTAVIGLSDRPQRARIRGCEYCMMKARCALRKQGGFCGT